MTLYVDEINSVTRVTKFDDNHAVVTYLRGEYQGDLVTAEIEDSGNGFIVCFPAVSSMQQDHYVCLDYSQARDLVLGLAEFKKELGFTED